MRYQASANHYWVFSDEFQWITDYAPETNFLTEALYERYDNGSFASAAVEIQNDFANPQRSLFTPLNSPNGFVGSSQLKKGLFPDDTKSVWLSRRASANCFKLVPYLQSERPYFRSCLVNPEECEYGLSVSIWVNFLQAQIPTKQVLISTCKWHILDCKLFEDLFVY